VAALIKKRDLGWLPTVIVLAVVLTAGSRLMYLSVQHHATAARATASSVAAAYVGKIEPEFQRLGNLASRQALAAAKALANVNTFTSLESLPLASSTLWMTADDRVLAGRPTEGANASGIASEWESAESARRCRAHPFSGRCGWAANGSLSRVCPWYQRLPESSLLREAGRSPTRTSMS